ncbi:MAG: NAD(P)-dependent oxidoreductase, partial [Candidatus Rokuibacteriota bacterium]
MAKPRVLVTGLSGLIGRALRKQIEGRVELSALNRSAVDGVPCHRADIADLEAIAPAFEGVDTVVHLAADATSPNPPWPSILNSNVTGTYNVYEAARRAKVKRVIFASSGATVAGIESDPPYRDLVAGRYDGLTSWPMVTHLSPARPSALYGVSKVWGEVLGRQYADIHGLSVICVRIGRVRAEDRPL